MTMGSLELRSSGSYGSLRQQLFHNGVSALQVIPPRKPPKMLKDKDCLFHWICKFAPRRKFGKLLLYAASAAVLMGVLYVGKGEEAQDSGIHGIRLNITITNQGYLPVLGEIDGFRKFDFSSVHSVGLNLTIVQPPPPVYFTGCTLPLGNPCEGFRLPPPPADPKRTEPRHKFELATSHFPLIVLAMTFASS